MLNYTKPADLFLKRPWLEWLFIPVLVVLVRLPYLLGEHLFFDGDEAVLGIMARDLITGTNFPIYFYGQQYGFSLFEAASAGLFMLFFGSTVYSIKFGALLLFSFAIKQYSELLLKQKLDWITYLAAILMVACFPTWLVWGTKLRGGYVTAFLFFALIAKQLFLHPHWERKDWLKVSVYLAFIAVSQVLFLLPLLPLLAQRFFQQKKIKDYLIPVGTTLLAYGVLRLPAYLNPKVWTVNLVAEVNWETYYHYFFEGFWSHFTDFFLYGDIYEVPSTLKIKAMLFVIGLLSVCVLGIYRFKKQQKTDLVLLLIGILLSSFPIVLFRLSGGRYLLAFYTGLLLVSVLLIIRFKDIVLRQTQVASWIGALLLLSSTVHYGKEYISYWLEPRLNDMAVLNELMGECEKRDINHLISSDWFLYWQINYLGNEKINCRFVERHDRVDRFTTRVDECYQTDNCKIALVGGHWPLFDMQTVEGWNESIEKINDRYYLYENPDIKFLNKAGYKLPEKRGTKKSAL